MIRQARSRHVDVPRASTKQPARSKRSVSKRHKRAGSVAAHKSVLKRKSVQEERGSGTEGDRESDEDDDQWFYQQPSDFDHRSEFNVDKLNRPAEISQVRQKKPPKLALAPPVLNTGTFILTKQIFF